MRDCATCQSRRESLFKDVSAKTLESLRTGFAVRQFQPKDVVFYQGSPVDAFYFLCEGSVKLVRDTPEGNQVIVDIVGPCGRFGEVSFMADALQSVTAEALEPATVKVMKRSALSELLREDPTLLIGMVENLNASLAEARATYAGRIRRSVRLRILNLLSSLFDRYGRRVNGSWELGIPLARSEIAEILGATTETTIRTLAQLQREGYLKLGRRRISASDPKRLRSLSEEEALECKGEDF